MPWLVCTVVGVLALLAAPPVGIWDGGWGLTLALGLLVVLLALALLTGHVA